MCLRPIFLFFLRSITYHESGRYCVISHYFTWWRLDVENVDFAAAVMSPSHGWYPILCCLWALIFKCNLFFELWHVSCLSRLLIFLRWFFRTLAAVWVSTLMLALVFLLLLLLLALAQPAMYIVWARRYIDDGVACRKVLSTSSRFQAISLGVNLVPCQHTASVHIISWLEHEVVIFVVGSWHDELAILIQRAMTLP